MYQKYRIFLRNDKMNKVFFNVQLKKMSSLAVQKESYPSYESFSPYTITIAGEFENGELNLDEVMKQLEVVDVEFTPKPNKKVKVDVVGKPGDILGCKKKVNNVDTFKGINKGTKAFNNCISHIITVGDSQDTAHNIDFKLFKNSIHSTGSKKLEETIQAWESIKSQLVKMKGIGTVDVENINIAKYSFNMINKSFKLGFSVLRDNLCICLNSTRDSHNFYAHWKPGVHKNGVSVKYPLEKLSSPDDLMSDKKNKKKKLPRCVTFIVFATGSVIISGDNHDDMKRVYNLFREKIIEIQDDIKTQKS